MLPWKPTFSIGVEEIDAQHRTLFERVARLEAAIEAREPSPRLQELFTYLEDYARAHFAAEEQLMRDADYPGLTEHVQEHSEFKRRLRSLVPQWESEGDSTAMLFALGGLLRSWLADHVTSSDQRIGDFLRGRAPSWDRA